TCCSRGSGTSDRRRTTGSVVPLHGGTTEPVVLRHGTRITDTVPSALAVTTRPPSGVKARLATRPCGAPSDTAPRRVRAAPHKCTVAPSSPEASNPPLPKATDTVGGGVVHTTWPPWRDCSGSPSFSASSRPFAPSHTRRTFCCATASDLPPGSSATRQIQPG